MKVTKKALQLAITALLILFLNISTKVAKKPSDATKAVLETLRYDVISVENIYYSVQLAKSMGFTKIALATDPFQSRMMKWPSRRMNIEIDFIPFTFEALDSMGIKELDIDAKKAFVENFV